MRSLSLFVRGRRPWIAIAGVLLALAVGWGMWWWAIEVSVMGSRTGRAVVAWEVAATAGGVAVAVGSLSLMPSWDSAPGPRLLRAGAWSAVLALSAAGAVPLVLHSALSVAPSRLVPRAADFGVGIMSFGEVFPVGAARSVSVIAISSTALLLLLIGLLGRWVGAAAALMVIASLLMVPGSGLRVPLVLLEPERGVRLLDTLLMLALCVGATVVWSRSGCAAKALATDSG